MYFSNFKEKEEVYYSSYLKIPSLYKQLTRFYDFYNFHSVPITFNEKKYHNFKFEFLQKITFSILFQTLQNEKNKDFDELYKEMNNKYAQFFEQEKISLNDFKYKSVSWKEFNLFLETNSFNEKSIQEFLPSLSVNIKEQKFDYLRYKKLYKQTKKELIIACLSSVFSRTEDMNYKVLKNENVYTNNILNV
jgi:hypothetical protein